MIRSPVYENPFLDRQRSIAQTHVEGLYQIRLPFLLFDNPPPWPHIEEHFLGGVSDTSRGVIDWWLREVLAHRALPDLLPEVEESLLTYESNLVSDLVSQRLPHKNSHAVLASIREARLHVAVQMSDLALVQRLLALGTNPNASAANGCSPLMRALGGHGAHHKGIIDVLLACPDILLNSPGEKGARALTYAAASGNADSVAALLNDPKIDVNSWDMDAVTALMVAAKNGHANIVGALLQDPRIDVNWTDDKGRTALDYAVAGGNADSVALLMGRADVCDHTLSALQVSVNKRRQMPVRMIGTTYIGLATLSPDRFKTMIDGMNRQSIELVLASMLFGIHEREVITLEEILSEGETLKSAIEAGSVADRTLRAIDHALSRLPTTESGEPDTEALREIALDVDKFSSQRFLTDPTAFGRFAGNEMVRMACNKVGFQF
jgi:hypothetical protein